MRRITSLIALALLLHFIFGFEHMAVVKAQGPGTPPVRYWMVCAMQGESVMTDRGIRTTVYISGAIPIQPPYTRDNPAAKAFAQFISDKLPPGTNRIEPRCWNHLSPEAALGAVKRPGDTPAPGAAIDVDCTHIFGECVMTGWTSGPAAPVADTTKRPPVVTNDKPIATNNPNSTTTVGRAAATPVAPVAPVASAPASPPPAPASNQPARGAVVRAPAAPPTPYAFCWAALAGRAPIAYFGASFEAPVRTIPAWTAAYKEFLTSKYKFAGVIHCATAKSSDEAQQEEERMRGRWQIIETGWTYQ